MSKMLWIFKWGEGKEKRWVVMGMLVGKRWGELDGSFFFFFEKTDGSNYLYIYIYIYIKETKSSQHMKIEHFFLEEANK